MSVLVIFLTVVALICFIGSMIINLTPNLKTKYKKVAPTLLIVGWFITFLIFFLTKH
jgi:hypothetical protein